MHTKAKIANLMIDQPSIPKRKRLQQKYKQGQSSKKTCK